MQLTQTEKQYLLNLLIKDNDPNPNAKNMHDQKAYLLSDIMISPIERNNLINKINNTEPKKITV